MRWIPAMLIAGAAAAGAPNPGAARERVAFAGPHVPGEIVVSSRERKLYLVLGDGSAKPA